MKPDEKSKETSYIQLPPETSAPAANPNILKEMAVAIKLMLGLPPADEVPETILNLFGLKNLLSGQNLYPEEKDREFLYFILNGKVDFAIAAGPNKITRLKTLGRGQLCGGLHYISGEKDKILATVSGATILLALHYEDCDLLCREYAPLAPRLVPLYYKRLFVAALGKNHLFSSLSIQEKIDLFQFFRVQILKTGQPILEEGSPGRYCCLILSGKAESAKETPSQGANLAFYEPGSLFGEVALLTGGAHTQTVQAADSTICALLHKEDLQKLVGKYPLVWKELEALALSHSENILSIMKDVVAEVADSSDYQPVSKPAQGRQDPRFSVTQYEIQAQVSAGDKGFAGLVLNISNGGLLLQTAEKPPLGETVAVTFLCEKQPWAKELLHQLTLSAKVVRAQDGAVALSLQGALSGELEQFSKFVQETASRKAKGILYPRYEVEKEKIRVSFPHGNDLALGQLLSISQTEMVLRCSQLPPVGVPLNFRLRLSEKKGAEGNPFPGGDVLINAIVMRHDQDCFEVQFQYSDVPSKTRILNLVTQLARRQGFMAQAPATPQAAPAAPVEVYAPPIVEVEAAKQAVVPVLLNNAKLFLQEYFFNINEGGGVYRCKQKFQATDAVVIRLQLHFKEKKLFKENIDLPAIVAKNTPEGIAVKFSKFPSATTRKLEALVQNLVKRQENAAWLRRRQVAAGNSSPLLEQTLAGVKIGVPQRPLSTRLLLWTTVILGVAILIAVLYQSMEEAKFEKTAVFLSDPRAQAAKATPPPGPKVSLTIDGKEHLIDQGQLRTLELGKDGRFIAKTKDGTAVTLETGEVKKLPAHLQRQAAKLERK